MAKRWSNLAEGQVGWPLYRFWYETKRVPESLGNQTPQRVARHEPVPVAQAARRDEAT